MEADTALAPSPEATSSVTLFGTTEPVLLIERATSVANALSRVIEQKQLFSNISGKKHVRVEGWTLLGSILGVFPCVVRTTELFRDEGKSFGFEAVVEARTRGGEVVGSAVARCTRDEKRWRGADDYAILSMASTRATSKALRLPLGWVVTMAGFEATPAEEMDGVFDRGEAPPVPRARREPPREAEPAPREAPKEPENFTWEDVKASAMEMLRLDAALARKDIKAACEAAGLKKDGVPFKEWTPADWLAINPHLPEGFRLRF